MSLTEMLLWSIVILSFWVIVTIMTIALFRFHDSGNDCDDPLNPETWKDKEEK